jgi:UDP:flavonoid glycosyltransferase YjiC (YdhE family)
VLRRPRRLVLGAFGDPGHAFPMIALGSALVARGHEVVLETWTRWRSDVEALGMTFAPAPEYPPFPTRERPLKPYEAAYRAALETRALVASVRPDALIHDVLTLGPGLAGELEGVPVGTLIPHVHPGPAPGLAPFSLGARRPRTAVGRSLWRALEPVTARGFELGRVELNETRRRLGLAPQDRVFGGLSERLCMVATFPALEYPRPWPAGTHVVGPLLWELPSSGVFAAPPGDGPLVLVAPSTSQDPEQQLVRTTLAACASLSVRVLAVAPDGAVGPVPANATVVDWLSYAQAMPHCDVVVMHGGHGTLARALACGCVPVLVPAAGDQAENGARIDWAGVGVRVPRRLCTAAVLRLAIERALDDPARGERARAMARWLTENDPGAHAAGLVEALAAS